MIGATSHAGKRSPSFQCNVGSLASLRLLMYGLVERANALQVPHCMRGIMTTSTANRLALLHRSFNREIFSQSGGQGKNHFQP